MGIGLPSFADDIPEPDSVTVAGNLQEALGCSGNWDPACEASGLIFGGEDGNDTHVWRKTFTVPAGDWEYKAPLNGAWDDNFGLGGERDGDNIPLSLPEESQVRFFYDNDTHWITDNVNSVIATAAGDFQAELGCPDNWQPWCMASWMQDPDGDGVLVFTTTDIPEGDYEFKVALDEDWAVNFGLGGQNGGNVPFSVPGGGGEVTLTFDSNTEEISVNVVANQPDAVTIAGSLQSELGCPGDWQPECTITDLVLGGEDEQDISVWRKTFTVPAGDWEYKAVLNNDWAEGDFGLNAEPGGANIPLSLSEETDVRFFLDFSTGWATDNVNSVIATAAGSFQDELGCPGDWQPWCLTTWLQDPDGDGVLTFRTTQIPPGDYEFKVALDEAWDVSFGLDGGPNNIPLTVSEPGEEVVINFDSRTNDIFLGDIQSGNLDVEQAHWLTADTLLWDIDTQAASEVVLRYAPEANIEATPDGIVGGNTVTLTLSEEPLSDELAEQYPHLADMPVFKLPEAELERVPDMLQAQLAVIATTEDGGLVDATGVQLPGVLDDLFAYDGDLGPVYNGDTPSLHLWAPTAQNVNLLLYPDANPDTAPMSMPMTRDMDTGVWSIEGQPDWDRMFYQYEVEVYVPATGNIETNVSTDPYTLSASADGVRSQIVNLDDADLKPQGWDNLEKPSFENFEDIVIYELHMRDFSVHDDSVPAEYKGKYKAFTLQESVGMTHLSDLSQYGVSHVHLLPLADCATISENPEDRNEVDYDTLASLPPDSEEQQALIWDNRDQDAFNWCYDPHHYNVPEGSYATDADGVARILEFREMVQGLSEAGLRTVMDVVYNHTSQALLGDKSVLDKVVPGYYHRLNGDGNIEMSTCCNNTASEHAMMEKLMVDSLELWAEQYKVDSFRFDLMGHHSLANMEYALQRLRSLTPEENGVDGEKIYLYGEGWNFGEVADDARFVQARQLQLGGSGIGSFNDRVRDAIRGGGPFDQGLTHVQNQGFINGRFFDPNVETGTSAGELTDLLEKTDRIRISLAGNLADYEFTGWDGRPREGGDDSVGYTEDPQENIVYAASHDNETLWDINQYKIPLDRTMDDRIRAQNLGNSLVILSQGVPFLQAGQELLRSKSTDRNTFNSSDWFNVLDFSLQKNGWGRGLPPAQDNEANWEVTAPLLADPELKPDAADMTQALEHVKEMLAIRSSSKLFRLTIKEEVQSQVSFENTGVAQIPGLIAMHITDSLSDDLDPERTEVMVLFNANDEAQTISREKFAGTAFELHPVQQSSVDPRVAEASFDSDTGTFSVPARTTVVFQVGQEAPDPSPVSDGAGGSLNAYLLALLALLGLAGRASRRRLAG